VGTCITSGAHGKSDRPFAGRKRTPDWLHSLRCSCGSYRLCPCARDITGSNPPHREWPPRPRQGEEDRGAGLQKASTALENVADQKWCALQSCAKLSPWKFPLYRKINRDKPRGLANSAGTSGFSCRRDAGVTGNAFRAETGFRQFSTGQIGARPLRVIGGKRRSQCH
jgi:hypothetical protein